MKAKSIHGPDLESVKAEIEKSIKDGLQPTIAIIFTSVLQDRKSLCKFLSDKNIDILGLTSCGEFTDRQHSEGETAILLLNLPRQHYAILFEEVEGSTLTNVAASIAQKSNQLFTNSSMILCSSGFNAKGEYFDGESMIDTLKKHLRPNTSFFGGMAGDDMTIKGSFVFTQGKETNNGVMALVLDADKVQLQGIAITGWQKMGISRTVTKSKGTLLYTIDDRPAVEMYLRYLGREDKTGDKEYKVLDELGLHYPFIVNRENGEMILRTPMSIDQNENALVVDSEMPVGSQFWFSIPPDFDIVETILDQASRMKELSRMEAEAMLIFSCAGRVNVLGPLTQSENEGLQQLWETPMAGFFSYGEYGPDLSGNHEYHSGACCWVAIKEKV